MTAALQFTDADIRAKVTEKSYERGVEYYDCGMVEEAVQRGNQLFAKVQGSEWDPYRICVTFTGDYTATCTCPYEWDGYCKHIVATLITVIDDSSLVPIVIRAPIADLLAGLDADALRTLVHRLIEAAPALVDVVDAFCGEEQI